MSKVRFVLNLAGLNELMKSGEMQEILNSAASQIADRAGDGFEVESAHPISFVGIASVRAATYKARRACNQENALEKAMGGTRI